MNSHWTRALVRQYLTGKPIRDHLKMLLCDWLSGDRRATYQFDPAPETAGVRPYLELSGIGQACTAKIHCSEIYSPDGTNELPVYVSPALDAVSDLGLALTWAQIDSGQMVLTGSQRGTLHEPDGPQGKGHAYHSKQITERIPGDSAADRIHNAPQVIAAVWLRAYERMWVRYQSAWKDPDADENSVELAHAAAAIRAAHHLVGA